MGGKRVELLHELAPRAVIALLMNPDNPNAASEQRDAQEAAQALGHSTVLRTARALNIAVPQSLLLRADEIIE